MSAVTDLACRRLHIIPIYLLFPARSPGCLGSADAGQRGEKWNWDRAAVKHHRFIVSKEQTIFLSVCLPPPASVGNRVMKASHLNDMLWQQNPCVGFALHSITNFTNEAAANCIFTTTFTCPISPQWWKKELLSWCFWEYKKG